MASAATGGGIAIGLAISRLRVHAASLAAAIALVLGLPSELAGEQ